jgi:ubiquinone/menaquinone biosynthesis C-methylase UbiE
LKETLNTHLESQFWINAWEEVRTKSPGATSIIRSDAEMIEYWNHLATSYDQAHSSLEPGKRVKVVMDILQRDKLLIPGDSIIDIGCGTGNYSIPFAKIGHCITAVDSSPEMCKQLVSKTKNLSLDNITVLNHLWEKLDLEQEGWHEKYDLSFASMTTAIFDYHTLQKMIRVSKRSCCLIFWAENGFNQVRKDLFRLIFKKDDPGSGLASIIYPFNLLYSLGYFPKIEFISSEWASTETTDKAIENLCRFFWLYTDITPEIKNIIANYVKEKAVHGLLNRKTKARLGVVSWDVSDIRDEEIAS